MGADEEGTLTRLNAHRREFLEPKIAQHQGRIVKRTGDGVLIEFASAGDATRCAVENAWRQVQGKVDAIFVDTGEQNLKNIERKVRVCSDRTFSAWPL
jgi:class 3 adenylate cyclase